MTRGRPEPRSETVLVQDILDHLLSLPESHARKTHGSRFSQAGEPDVDACVRGRTFKLEAKMPGEEPTPIQYASMRRWERAGALVGWATSLDEVRELLEHVDDRAWINPQLCRHDRHGWDETVADDAVADDAVVSRQCVRCGLVVAAELDHSHRGRL